MKLSFIGSSHIAYWILDRHFADQEYRSYGVPGAGIEYIERFRVDVSDSTAIPRQHILSASSLATTIQTAHH